MTNNFFDFVGGNKGSWKVISMNAICGPGLANVSHLDILQNSTTKRDNGIWTLTGFTSNTRYTEKNEKEQLLAVQADLGRPTAKYAALIPIGKSEVWWALAQDERRKIFETASHHTQIGLKYLPAIARKLYHCRDIGQPFDFLTWFEYAPEDSDAFEELLFTLRKTEEWNYVDREIDIRLSSI